MPLKGALPVVGLTAAGAVALGLGVKLFRSLQKARVRATCERDGISVGILGGGMSGLAAAIHLTKAGIPFTIYEKADDIGGTWYLNRYPGAACDIESFLYQFSFEQSTDWSSNYPKQPEIHRYLKKVVAKHNLGPSIKLNTRIVEAVWDDLDRKWNITHENVKTGEKTTTKHTFFVGAQGPLHHPLYPTGIDGFGSFKGQSWHSAEWPADKFGCITGKRVALVGSAASAAQILPAIAPLAESVTVFQRTPSWISPRRALPCGPSTPLLFSIPFLAQIYRSLLWFRHELLFNGWKYAGGTFSNLMRSELTRHMRHQIKDPALRAQLIPSYTPGCKRIIVSDEYLPAFNLPNVRLVTRRIEKITEDGIVVAGRDSVDSKIAAEEGAASARPVPEPEEFEFDVIVYATGFKVMRDDDPMGQMITTRGGEKLRDVWGDRPTALYGLMSAKLPNAFLLLGPNTGLGHNTVIFMVERQVELMMRLLRPIVAPITPGDFLLRWTAKKSDAPVKSGRGVRSLSVRPEREAAFVKKCDDDSKSTVWISGGCQSWYLNSAGVAFSIWPRSTQAFWWLLRNASRRDFVYEA